MERGFAKHILIFKYYLYGLITLGNFSKIIHHQRDGDLYTPYGQVGNMREYEEKCTYPNLLFLL